VTALPRIPGVEVEHHYVEARGVRFHVALAGPPGAEPLVLLHGWPQHWYEWRKLLPALAEHRRCVAPDLRGLGWSDAPAGGYDRESLADDVLGVLDALEIERTDLIAHDWGGWIGFLIALREPARLRRFLALGIPPPWPPWGPGRPKPRFALGLWRLWYQLVLAFPWLGESLVRRPRLVRSMLDRDTVHADTFSHADLDAFAAPLSEPARARASSRLYRTFLARELLPVARGRYDGASLQVPSRMLLGERDRFVDPAQAEAAAALSPALSVVRIPDSGHFIAEERPDVVLAHAYDFLEAGEGPPATAATRERSETP